MFQNLTGSLYARIPAFAEHNIAKYQALKKAFYLTALEKHEGDYLEFGVFTGSSFVFSVKAHRSLQGLAKLPTRFFGFDSFAGFGPVGENEKHPFYTDNNFSVDVARVTQNIKKQTKGAETRLVPGFFEETLRKSTSSYGIQRARIVLIDCDLKEPASLALQFVRPILQQGTILIMDDFFSYKGDTKRGVHGAFSEFCQKNPAYIWRRVCDYGFGGAVMILVGSP